MINCSDIEKQISFITETDKLKNVLRKTSPINMTRKENSAEHSWQVILSALVFSKHANDDVDLLKVVKMLAVHDIVEIDVGDTFHYDKSANKDLFKQELAAAERILSLLDDDQKREYLELWIEFETRETPEAKYAASVDRIMAFIMNSNNNGGNWPENNITVEKALDKNAHMEDGSKALWKAAKNILHNCESKGFIKNK